MAIGALLIALLVLGNYAMSPRQPQADETETYSPAEAAVYVEVVTPTNNEDTVARITANGSPNEIQVTDADLIATARTALGDVDLVTFKGTDNAGTAYSCLGTVERLLTGSTCATEPTDDVQVYWGESATSQDFGLRNRQDLSVTIFNAPTEAVSMFVLLDNNRYVGADVFGGASYLTWQLEVGGFGQLILVDAAGDELYRQTLG